MNLDRRQLLTYAIGLVGGSVAVTAFGAIAPGDVASAAGNYFSSPRRALLDEVANLMIPATDTPGALAVGVPQYIDNMMAHWASQDTQKAFDGLLDEIDAQAAAQHGKKFLALDEGERLAFLTQFDAGKFTGDMKSMMGPYPRFKDLLMSAYYLSEVGATQELRLVEVPGPFRGDIPLSEVGRAWAY